MMGMLMLGKDIDRHAQRGEGAEDKNQQRDDHERVGPAERNPDYGKHARQPSGAGIGTISALFQLKCAARRLDIAARQERRRMALWGTP